MGKKSYPPYDIHEIRLLQVIDQCIAKSKQLINDALIIIEGKGSLTHALGLYTFAIEEYGKALLLKECEKAGEYYKVPRYIFGLKRDSDKMNSHDIKFDKALKCLSDNFTNIKLGVKKSYSSNYADIVPVNPEGDTVHIPEGTTGTFSLVKDYLVNFQARLRCFLIDWNDEKNQWFLQPIPEEESLKETIMKFKQYLNETPHSLCGDRKA